MNEQQFIELLKSLIKDLYTKSMTKMTKVYEPYDLTAPQVSILMHLKDKKWLKISELALKINTPDSNISSICRRLEKRNLIQRRRDEDDRRIVYVAATSEAEALYEEFEKNKRDMYKTIRNISDEDKENIINALNKLNKIIDDAFNNN